MAMARALTHPDGSIRARPGRRAERFFFGGMAALLLLTVFAGFGPTYFMRSISSASNVLTPALHVHGLAFSAWMVLLVIQTSLVATNRVDVHRRLGVAGATLAAVMTVLGAYVAITRTADGSFVTPPGTDPLGFLPVPLATVVVFPVLVAAALRYRRRPDVHKRLMLIATLEIVTAAVARLPFVVPLGPLGFFGGIDLFLVAMVVYDLATAKRIHPATFWGGLFLVVSQPLRLLLGTTEPWLEFAAWLTS